jgi:hypothetical protein
MRNEITEHRIRNYPLFDGYKRHVLTPSGGMTTGDK